MNEKIKKLKQQSMRTVQSYGAFGEPESYEQLDEELFAKLIIQECIFALEPINYSWHKKEYFADAAELIKEHFRI